MYEQILAPLSDIEVLWPGGTRGFRVVARERTTVVATDGLSAPSLVGALIGSMVGVGAEFFVETIDPELRADESVCMHWLFTIIAAVAAHAASGDGASFRYRPSRSKVPDKPSLVVTRTLKSTSSSLIARLIGCLIWRIACSPIWQIRHLTWYRIHNL